MSKLYRSDHGSARWLSEPMKFEFKLVGYGYTICVEFALVEMFIEI